VEGQEYYKKRRITGEAREQGKTVKMNRKKECRKIRGKKWSKRSSFSENLDYRIINLTNITCNPFSSFISSLVIPN
jgi:hypothetical protein